MRLNSIVILGSGNVATHLAKALNEVGCNILQIYSRNIANAESLAKLVNANPIDNTQQMHTNADLYLVCLSDSVIGTVLKELEFEPKLIAHTAGSLSIDILKQFKYGGVFYPLQTFTKERELSFEELPLCIEANSEDVKDSLWELAECLSNNVRELNSDQRKQCHIAGVLVNNFVNHLYGLGADVLNAKDISFDILQPIILETAKKVQELHPDKAQTGPALRRNEEVLKEHAEMLKPYGLDEMYRLLSESIMRKK